MRDYESLPRASTEWLLHIQSRISKQNVQTGSRGDTYLGGIPPGLLTVTTNRSTKKSTSKTAKTRVGSDHNLQFGSRINETLVASHLLRAEPRTPTPKP